MVDNSQLLKANQAINSLTNSLGIDKSSFDIDLLLKKLFSSHTDETTKPITGISDILNGNEVINVGDALKNGEALNAKDEPGEDETTKRIEDLQEALKTYTYNSDPSVFNDFDYIRNNLVKTNQTDALKNLDEATNKILQAKDQIKMKIAGGDFVVNDEMSDEEIVKPLEDGAEDIPENLRALISQFLARDFIKDPDRINTLLKEGVTIYLAQNQNQADGQGKVIGLFLPKAGTEKDLADFDTNQVLAEQAQTQAQTQAQAQGLQNHVMILDRDQFLTAMAQPLDKEDKSDDPLNVLRHEGSHLNDALDGKVDGLPYYFNQNERQAFVEMRDALMADYKKNPEKYPENFRYLFTNKAEFVAGFLELSEADPVTFQRVFGQNTAAFLAHVRGYNPTQSAMNA